MDQYSELLDILKKGEESNFYVGLAVINPQGEILLGKRKEDGFWTGPGGAFLASTEKILGIDLVSEEYPGTSLLLSSKKTTF